MAKVTASNLKAAFEKRISIMAEKPDTKAENLTLMQRCHEYLAKPASLEMLNAGGFDVREISGDGAKPMAVYAVKRLVDLLQLAELSFDCEIGANNQKRYVRNMIVTVNNGLAKEAQFSRLDQRATGSKGQSRETATGYADGAINGNVRVATRIMATGTTATQTTNTLATFKSLNMIADNGQRGSAYRWFANGESVLLKRFAGMVAAAVAKEQGLTQA